jgi:hypothetical protein
VVFAVRCGGMERRGEERLGVWRWLASGREEVFVVVVGDGLARDRGLLFKEPRVAPTPVSLQ